MKHTSFFVVILAFTFLQSCSNNENSNDLENTEKQTPSIDPNGPDIEINVLAFDLEKSETTIEIINRMDEPITSISGRLYFYDEAGGPMTTATNSDLSSPFETAQSPQVVGSMASVEKVLKNRIPGGTNDIKVGEISGKKTSGSF